VGENDLKDISEYGVNLTRLKHVAPTMEWVGENDEWKPLVQSYLACLSFVDHQVGKMLDALDASPYKDNTYIVLHRPRFSPGREGTIRQTQFVGRRNPHADDYCWTGHCRRQSVF